MALCPSEHMHLLLQALKDNDRELFAILLAEMQLWLAVASNELPRLRMAVVAEDAMEAAEATLREQARDLRARMEADPSRSRARDRAAAGHEQVAEALHAVCADTDFFLVQP